MPPPPLHSWNITPKVAVALQRVLAARTEIHTPLDRCELIAGADASYNRFSPTIFAAVVVVRVSDGAVIETQHAVGKANFPYVPGLLSFREAPIVLEAFANLKQRPDAVMLDGQGYAHPRRLGLACHVGLWLDLPCFGCAKSRLVGVHREPGRRAGSRVPLMHNEEVIGSVVRTKAGVKPVYVSPGNRIDLASAVRWTLASCRGYRIPEPTRQAHLAVNEIRRRTK